MTVLNTHDGIGVIDAGASADGNPGLLSPAEIDNLVEIIHRRSKGQSRQAAGASHYANMAAIALAAIFLGYLADKIGCEKTIILGLVLFAINSCLFAVGNAFAFFLVLLVISGASI